MRKPASPLPSAPHTRGGAEDGNSAVKQLRFPLRDLVRVNIELLRQFAQRLVPLDGGQSHLRLECRCMIPARSSRHLLRHCQAETPLITLFRFAEPAATRKSRRQRAMRTLRLTQLSQQRIRCRRTSRRRLIMLPEQDLRRGSSRELEQCSRDCCRKQQIRIGKAYKNALLSKAGNSGTRRGYVTDCIKWRVADMKIKYQRWSSNFY